MDSGTPCVINWGAGFIYWLPSDSEWWNTERCVRNVCIFNPVMCGCLDWLMQRLSLCYLKSTHENGVGNQILCKWLTAFSLNLRTETIFLPQIFSISDGPLWDEPEISSEDRGKLAPMPRAHSPNVTEQGSPVRPD